MAELVGIKVRARLDPDPKRELERWRERLAEADATEANDIRIRLDRYEQGQEVIVSLVVTLELSNDGASTRRACPDITGVWFAHEEEAGNEEHARDLVIGVVKQIVSESGIPRQPTWIPIAVELDESVCEALT